MKILTYLLRLDTIAQKSILQFTGRVKQSKTFLIIACRSIFPTLTVTVILIGAGAPARLY